MPLFAQGRYEEAAEYLKQERPFMSDAQVSRMRQINLEYGNSFRKLRGVRLSDFNDHGTLQMGVQWGYSISDTELQVWSSAVYQVDLEHIVGGLLECDVQGDSHLALPRGINNPSICGMDIPPARGSVMHAVPVLSALHHDVQEVYEYEGIEGNVIDSMWHIISLDQMLRVQNDNVVNITVVDLLTNDGAVLVLVRRPPKNSPVPPVRESHKRSSSSFEAAFLLEPQFGLWQNGTPKVLVSMMMKASMHSLALSALRWSPSWMLRRLVIDLIHNDHNSKNAFFNSLALRRYMAASRRAEFYESLARRARKFSTDAAR
jgi:hypothetical protein